ncbi:hypothetical protein Tco_0994024 [Tanacetum coccineum]
MTHLDVVLLYLVLLYYEVTLLDIIPLRPILGVLQSGPKSTPGSAKNASYSSSKTTPDSSLPLPPLPELDEVLSWLLVGGYLDANVMLMKAIALLRLAIRSSPGRNDGTARPKSSCGNTSYGCCGTDGACRVVKVLVKAIVDTVMDCTEVDGCCSMKVCGDS